MQAWTMPPTRQSTRDPLVAEDHRETVSRRRWHRRHAGAVILNPDEGFWLMGTWEAVYEGKQQCHNH